MFGLDLIDGKTPELIFEVPIGLRTGEPTDFILNLDGRIILIDDTDAEIEAGRVVAYRVLFSVSGFTEFDVLDSDMMTAQYLPLIDVGEDWRETVSEQIGDALYGDLLIIDRVEIKPEFRGHGLGLAVVHRTIEAFGGNCSVAALQPYPLQYRDRDEPGWRPPPGVVDIEKAFREARQKLARYWGRLGFKKIRGTEIYALAPAMRQPSLEQALGQRTRVSRSHAARKPLRR